jgi:hypothetical protein
MEFSLKKLAVLILLPIASVTVAFAAYDLAVFQPHKSDIAALIQTASPEDRNVPVLIQDLICRDLGTKPHTQVARHLLMHLFTQSEHRKGGSLGWHARFGLWNLLVRLHLSEDELMALYASLAYNGVGTGMNALARRMYGKNLSQLSSTEAAALVVYLRAPGRYARYPE